jgi:putative phosphoesterase
MKVAFLSDIHANFPALWSALEDARRRGARSFVVAGDIVGGGPHPVEVARFLMKKRVAAIRGNVDRKTIAQLSKPRKLEKKAKKGALAALARWAALQLGDEERAWLSALPPELRLTFGHNSVLVVHGSPIGDEDYIYPSITERALAAKLKDEKPDLLVCGHSHVPFVRKVAETWIANCGSVGKPIDGDPRGSYALVDFKGRGAISARIVRFEYPVEEAAHDLERLRSGFAPAELRSGVKS